MTIGGGGIFFAAIIIAIVIGIIPFMIVVILVNLGMYRRLSRKLKITAYLTSFLALFFINRSAFTFLFGSFNGAAVFFVYLFIVLVSTLSMRRAADEVVKKARWIILGITIVV